MRESWVTPVPLQARFERVRNGRTASEIVVDLRKDPQRRKGDPLFQAGSASCNFISVSEKGPGRKTGNER